MLRRASSPIALALVCVFGCAGDPPPKAASPKTKSAAQVAPSAMPTGHLARMDVERVLRQGPAWVFRRVLHEEVVRDDGQLVGWRVTGLPEEWASIDLAPGDVITKVNGVAIIQPDDAWNVWKGLAKANEIRIDITRAGKARELVLPIDGGPSQDVVRALESDQPPPRTAPPVDKGTVVIKGDDSVGSDVDFEP